MQIDLLFNAMCVNIHRLCISIVSYITLSSFIPIYSIIWIPSDNKKIFFRLLKKLRQLQQTFINIKRNSSNGFIKC